MLEIAEWVGMARNRLDIGGVEWLVMARMAAHGWTRMEMATKACKLLEWLNMAIIFF